MADCDRRRLRTTFTEDAELYDRARPGYPPELFDDLAELTTVGKDCRVLEIGCGTAQATIPLARRGCQVVAVELGAQMADIARRNLAMFPAVRVATAAFEDWGLPDEPFDVVFAATAFHWIDPATRVQKAADALRIGGSLATITTHHIAGGSVDFFHEAQACYEKFDPATPVGLRLVPAVEIPRDSTETDRSGRFGPALFRRYEWELSYSTGQYVELLNTYSGNRALDPAHRIPLLECIGKLIDGSYGGQITKRYLSELQVATRSD
ncbi:MAG: class I SAM-dependent methyltransferase [Mycobacterium sp.]|nr:class I SAM-dependent methyltransferase [Mycobacterium sp.]